MSTHRNENERRRVSQRWLVAGILSFVIVTALAYSRRSLLTPAAGEVTDIPHTDGDTKGAALDSLTALNYPYAADTFRGEQSSAERRRTVTRR